MNTKIQGTVRLRRLCVKAQAQSQSSTRCFQSSMHPQWIRRKVPCGVASLSQRGFTLFELIIVIIIVVTLMGLLMNRVRFYQEHAEKVAMEEVTGAVQSALTLQYGRLLTRGKSTDAATLAVDNPMNWLQKKPLNYAGEFYEPTPLSVDRGNWVFDLKSRNLVYFVNNTAHFQPGVDGKAWVRFRIVTKYEPSRLPSLRNAPDELTGILFEPLEPYSWF